MDQNDDADPPPNKPLAIHPGLWAIEHHFTEREPRQVIKFRGAIKSTKFVSITQRIISDGENLGAEPPWSSTELNVHGVSRNELAVVVGILVPHSFRNSIKVKQTRTLQAFEKDKHLTCEAPSEVFIVVRPLVFERNTSYILYKYQEPGGCEIYPLPAALESCVLFFKEWVHDYADPLMKKRHDNIANNITNFAKQYLKDHEEDFTDAGLASTRSKNELQGLTKHRATPAILQSFVQRILQRPEECTGDKDALTFIKLMRAVWFPAEGSSIDWLDIAVVKQFITGLKHGALNDYDTPPAMWRSFIVQVCSSLYERPEDDPMKLVERIRRVHRTVIQAGINYNNSQAIVSEDGALSRVYNVAISAMKLALEQAKAEQSLVRQHFMVPPSSKRSIDDIISSLIDGAVSRDQRLSDIRDLAALSHLQHEMLFRNQTELFDTVIKVMGDLRVHFKDNEMDGAQMEGVENHGTQMDGVENHGAQLRGNRSEDADFGMTDDDVNLAIQRQLSNY
ncbi:hypothetical protein FGADI_9005 [Fusarium gaditjirri]|uniref:Uncharacterized protein n=1 Tax=Fusarium gaditjirri TaxID=282569 RepID=A0A8H4WSL8_9HYPO|nr:hypothetical protein FGADI_9005 [Fusarium gaditjirri]